MRHCAFKLTKKKNRKKRYKDKIKKKRKDLLKIVNLTFIIKNYFYGFLSELINYQEYKNVRIVTMYNILV